MSSAKTERMARRVWDHLVEFVLDIPNGSYLSYHSDDEIVQMIADVLESVRCPLCCGSKVVDLGSAAHGYLCLDCRQWFLDR